MTQTTPLPALTAVAAAKPRSLPIEAWPQADRAAWQAACRPSQRLTRGGAASHLAEVSRNDLARRYGYFLDHLARTGRLDREAGAAEQVTPDNVETYRAELQSRVGSVTLAGSIAKLRRAAELIAPNSDFGWLREIENDLAFVMQPKSKLSRVVAAEALLEAGLTLVTEAELSKRSDLAKARMVRNGVMLALLSCYPMRLKNFAALDIGTSLVEIDGAWWVVLGGEVTKSRRPDQRRLPNFLTGALDSYLNHHRPVLLARSQQPSSALWLSSNDGTAMSYSGVERVISATTLETIGIDISPHLFRTAAATTAAIHAGSNPHLASALLQHTDPNVTQAHYNRATSLTAAKTFAQIVRDEYRK